MKNSTPLLAGFDGTTPDKELERHLSTINPVGVILFKRNFISLRQGRKLISYLRGLLGDIIVATDHEGGVVSRFPADCPVPPSPRSLREAGDADLINKACRLQAEALEYLGIDLNLAPVLDIGGYPGNQAIGTRAFSPDPLEIAEYGEICLKEHRRLKIGVVAKHFPGHGRTSVDSHRELGKVKASADSLWTKDLSPFRRIIKSGAPAVMPAHLVYPALDPDLPATFSEKIVSDLLRKKMNFNGLAVTDCLEMKAVSKNFTPEDMIRLGIKAGVDLWTSSFSLKRSREFQTALKRAFDKNLKKTDRKTAANILASQKRMASFLKTRSSNPESQAESDFPGSRFHTALELHGKTLLKLRQSPVPVGYNKFYLLELSNQERRGINENPSRNTAAEALIENCSLIVEKEIIFQRDTSRPAALVKLCEDKKLTLVLLTRGFQAERRLEFVNRLKEASSVIHIALVGDQDLVGVLPNEWTTWGYNHFTGKALAEELTKIATEGRSF